MNFQWLVALDLFWVVVLISALYLGLLIWALTRPKAVVVPNAQQPARWRDLRYWIVLLVVSQVALHWVFR